VIIGPPLDLREIWADRNAEHDRLREERAGMDIDASVIRYDEPGKEPWTP
jgi:hypothetical protein